MIYISGSWCVLSSRLPKHWHYYRLRSWHQTFSALLLCGCHVTSTFQKLPQELVAPKVCAAGTEGYREEEASSPQQHSWQLELQLFKGILPLLTWHSGRWKASSLVPLWNKSSAVSDVHVIQDSRYGAVEVQQLFKISPALNVYVKGACSGECTGESLLHIFNASFADDANTPSTAGFQPLLSNSSCNFSAPFLNVLLPGFTRQCTEKPSQPVFRVRTQGESLR